MLNESPRHAGAIGKDFNRYTIDSRGGREWLTWRWQGDAAIVAHFFVQPIALLFRQHEPNETESSVTPPTEPELAPEEAGDQNPLDYLLELEQAARDVPRDHPDDSGWLLRVRASLVRIRMAPTADTGCKAADLFNTDARVLMIVSLVKRLARENPETPMETAIGNVAIADEFERFDAIGLPPKDLALLCERLVPLACGL